LRGELDRAECRRVVRHLLTGCRVCRATARELWVFGSEPLRRSRFFSRFWSGLSKSAGRCLPGTLAFIRRRWRRW
jgi:hypothetical protein